MITNFEQLIERLRSRGERTTVAVVWASDPTTQGAVCQAIEEGFVDAIFVGCGAEVRRNDELMRHESHIRFAEAGDCDEAAREAVRLIREGEASVLMKGMLNTDNLLRAVLNKETGILPRGRVLTHITVAGIPSYHKLLFFTDAAVIPYPTEEQQAAQTAYLAEEIRAFGMECPRIALVHCSEKVDERHFPFTAGYRALVARAEAGEFGHCIVDGPMDLKTACSPKALAKKGMKSPIEGDADAVIFPDIEAGNVFYKTITLFCGAETAGILKGTIAPVVLPSRGDDVLSKFYSLALAAI